MDAMDVVTLINRELDGSIERLQSAISTGAAQDYATYKQLVGRMESLTLNQDYVKRLEQRLVAE